MAKKTAAEQALDDIIRTYFRPKPKAKKAPKVALRKTGIAAPAQSANTSDPSSPRNGSRGTF